MTTKTNINLVNSLNYSVATYSLNLHVILPSGYNTRDFYFTLVICSWNDLGAVWTTGNLTRMT